MLGGEPVVVSGPFFQIDEDDDIVCVFDGIEVNGIFVDSERALCVSPALSHTGRVPFQLNVTGITQFIGKSTFTSCMCSNCFA